MLISSMNSYYTQFIVWFHIYEFITSTPVETVLDPAAAVLDSLTCKHNLNKYEGGTRSRTIDFAVWINSI
jgi:hypothetical protein